MNEVDTGRPAFRQSHRNYVRMTIGHFRQPTERGNRMKHEVDEQAEAERLRKLRARIEELLHDFDACAVVFLGGREGRFEWFARLDASWSNLRYVEAPPGIALRSKLADYHGDAELQKQEQEWSVGVVSGFAHQLGMVAVQWLRVAERLDQATGATHTPWRRDDPRDKGGAA